MSDGNHRMRWTALAGLVYATLLIVEPIQGQTESPAAPGAGVPANPKQRPPLPTTAIPLNERNFEITRTGDAITGEAYTWSSIISAHLDTTDETLGATLQPVGEALRAQLDIAAGQGLLVAALRNDSPSAQAGLKQNDILLSLADQALAETEDLTKQLKAAGEAPLTLKLLRAGKPLSLQVRPVYRVTLGPVIEPRTEYFIGVSIESADEPLRAQLKLLDGHGVLVKDVVADSPAEKAGVKKHDIVIELGGKQVDSPEALTTQVQATKEKATALKLIRSGKPVALVITPAVRKTEASTHEHVLRYWLLNRQQVEPRTAAALYLTQPKHANTVATVATGDVLKRLDRLDKELAALHRIEAMEKELKALRDTLDRLTESLKDSKSPRRN